LEADLKKYLESFLSEERFARVNEVLSNRTKYITVVLEDLSNPLNANAAVRTLDCFGIQDLHVIENKHLFERDKQTSKGAIKWVDVYKHTDKEENTKKCLEGLKAKGYKIISTSPHATKSIYDIDFSTPLAFVFGNESDGISEDVKQNTDEFVSLPMYGFAESFNISVSVAMTLQMARRRIEELNIDWKLTDEEYLKIYDEWLMKSVNNSELISKRYLEEKE
jgi:tRNA (guanosine-2'-O-)-methyltransferase